MNVTQSAGVVILFGVQQRISNVVIWWEKTKIGSLTTGAEFVAWKSTLVPVVPVEAGPRLVFGFEPKRTWMPAGVYPEP